MKEVYIVSSYLFILIAGFSFGAATIMGLWDKIDNRPISIHTPILAIIGLLCLLQGVLLAIGGVSR